MAWLALTIFIRLVFLSIQVLVPSQIRSHPPSKAKLKHFVNTLTATAAIGLLIAAAPASASVIGFTSNATANAANGTAAATGLGATIDTSINFNTHPTGALQSNFCPRSCCCSARRSTAPACMSSIISIRLAATT